MEELQQMLLNWCEELQAYLKCNQCHQKLSQDVYLCDAGHFICCRCSQNEISSTKCYICKLKYTKVRNYLAENLVEKLDTVIEKIGGDDDDDDDAKSMCSNASSAWNNYQCWIDKCKFQGSIDDMREHCEKQHDRLYTKNIDKELPHKTIWSFDYGFPKIIDRVLHIPNVGLFLIHIAIYDNGALRAHLFIYDSGRNAKRYQYKIIIKCNNVHMTIEAEVDSSRIPKNVLCNKGMFIPRAHVLQQALQNHIKFTCELEIDNNTLSSKPRNVSRSRKVASKFEQRASNTGVSTLLIQQRNLQQNKGKKQKENREKTSQNIENLKINAETSGKNLPNAKKQNQKKAVEKNTQDKKKIDNCLQQSEAPPGRCAPTVPAQHNGSQAPQNGAQSPQYGVKDQQNHSQSFQYGVQHGFINNPGVYHPLGDNNNSSSSIPLLSPQAFGSTSSGQPISYIPQQYIPPRIPPQVNSPPFSGVFGNAHPASYVTAPSAPAEDASRVQYPDLTRMKNNEQRLSNLQNKIDEREKAWLKKNQSSQESDKDRDKCVIS